MERLKVSFAFLWPSCWSSQERLPSKITFYSLIIFPTGSRIRFLRWSEPTLCLPWAKKTEGKVLQRSCPGLVCRRSLCLPVHLHLNNVTPNIIPNHPSPWADRERDSCRVEVTGEVLGAGIPLWSPLRTAQDCRVQPCPAHQGPARSPARAVFARLKERGQIIFLHQQ